MDTVLQITLFLSFVTIICLTYALLRERKSNNILRNDLQSIRGQTDEELYGRGKNSELGLMTAGITHEISNPLTILLGKVEQMLRKNLSPEDTKKGLEQIKQNAVRISKIIQNVREYIYRNEEESEDFILLKDVVNSVLTFYGQRLKNHDIDLRLKNIDKVYLSGHKGQFEQALLNLISNSFDAIDSLEEKWIEISADLSGETVKIYVRDSGHGVPKEIREKMLSPFFTTKKGKGTGLGLTLVRGIAQKHGGDLKYVEEPNTTFMLELPKASSMSYHH